MDTSRTEVTKKRSTIHVDRRSVQSQMTEYVSLMEPVCPAVFRVIGTVKELTSDTEECMGLQLSARHDRTPKRRRTPSPLVPLEACVQIHLVPATRSVAL